MIAYFGLLSLFVALAAMIAQSIIPATTLAKNTSFKNDIFFKLMALIGFSGLSLALGLLIYAFLVSDFSIELVALHSHTAKPWIYKISGTWGNHEGSLLLLVWMMSLYGFLFSRIHPEQKVALQCHGMLTSGLLLFLIFTSNPFNTADIIVTNGLGLNPLLQDIGLALHPPLLYLGYTGFSLAFALAVSALWQKQMSANLIRALKYWVTIALAFLTIGIAMGSWWAYRELGWGGFWFWDPVENISIMPWLSGIALFHSLIALEKRGAMRQAVLLLSIIGFTLAMCGFFLVRSGVLTSVHSFASDPARGVFILSFITITTGAALTLYALRASSFASSHTYHFFSKDMGLVLQNALAIILTLTVLWGTIYPILMEIIIGKSVSVGAPYFNSLFNPLAAIALLLAAITPALRWEKDEPGFITRLWPAFAAGVLGAVILCLYYFDTVITFALPFTIIGLFLILSCFPVRKWPVTLSHVAAGLIMIGITVASFAGKEEEALMQAGKHQTLANREVIFNGAIPVFGQNYVAERGEVKVDGHSLFPERRIFPVEGQETTEAAIHSTILRDLYIVISQPVAHGQYGIHLFVKPLISLIWLGAMGMSIGLIYSLRYTRKQ